jgi:hypothetical protein
MSAAALVAIAGGVLLPLDRWWATVLGAGTIIGGAVAVGVGIYVGPRGRDR